MQGPRPWETASIKSRIFFFYVNRGILTDFFLIRESKNIFLGKFPHVLFELLTNEKGVLKN